MVQAYIPEGAGGGDGGGGFAYGPNSGRHMPPLNSLRITDNQDTSKNWDIEMKWSYIEKTVHIGRISPKAKIGDCDTWMNDQPKIYNDLGELVGTGVLIRPITYNLQDNLVFSSAAMVLRRQITDSTFEVLSVMGLQHINWVYQGKAVTVNAWDAFFKEDEEGFIVPINHELLKAMSLRDVTQMSYDANHLVLNCYQIEKKKWYQSGWFKVLLIIVAIVITVMSMGAAGFAAGSMLNAAVPIVASTLGVTAVLATYIVATLTVMAAMVIGKLLTPLAIDVFGEEWGPVIAALVTMFAMNFAATGSMFGSMAAQGTMQFTAQNLIQGSMAALNMYGKYMAGKIAGLDLDEELTAMKTEAEARMDEVEKLSKELLGTNADLIDITGFTKATQLAFESADTFISRTLMTGNDVAEITRGLVEDFAELGLQLPTTA